MTKNQPAGVSHKPVIDDDGTSPARAGDSLLYFVGCGTFWCKQGRRDALRELMVALDHVDPIIRCVSTQMECTSLPKLDRSVLPQELAVLTTIPKFPALSLTLSLAR